MIRIENISKTYKTYNSPNNALKNVSFLIKDGECVVIGGENGSGKSVLMSIVAGLESPDSGFVECKNSLGKKVSVGFVFQEAETQVLGETPKEDIAFGPKNLGWKKEKIESAVQKALEKTGLKEKEDYPARFLSGGEKRRLAIACMIAMDLPIIVLDEPYANLDYKGIKQVNELLQKLKSEGKTIIILTHEIEKCLGMAEKLIVLFKGEKVFEGTPEEGLKQNLEKWNIKNPLISYKIASDLVW